ncbi:MAG TPA: fatty acid desaturase [Polyangiaceae bacterium]
MSKASTSLDPDEPSHAFAWSGNPALHAERRRQMLAKYPDIERLYGPCPRTKYICLALVAAQLGAAYALRDASWWWIVIAAYGFGGFVNHALLLAIHELIHNLGFGRPWKNRLFAVFVNLPVGIPVSETFRHYHLLHHAHQGDAHLDADLPTEFEARLLSARFGKLIWLAGQGLAYTLRPLLAQPKKPSRAELLQFAVQLGFCVLVFHFWGAKACVYLPLSSLMVMGLHPVAGHYVTEHHAFRHGQETYSYYGPLNLVTFNIGYHNEHHDFPYVPGSRLAELRRVAPEFYEHLEHHDSRIKTLWRFFTRPGLGEHSRLKRLAKAA